MSTKFTAASGTQGISVPTTLPKQPVLVNKIHTLLENQALLPLGSAKDKFNQLEVLLKTIGEIAHKPISVRGEPADARLALMRIEALCEVGQYLAADQGNFIDCAREELANTHVPAIMEMIGGDS